MFDSGLFGLEVVSVGALVFFDYVTTRLMVQLITKHLGRDKALKTEFSPVHRYFWGKFGYPRGHILSSAFEYLAFLLILGGLMTVDPRELATFWFGFVAGSLVMASVSNYLRYKIEKKKFAELEKKKQTRQTEQA